MLPVPVHSFRIILQAGMEKILAEHLLEISQKIHADCKIKTYHIPYLPCHVYIEAPRIAEIQELMKFSAYGHLVSCATCISDDINCNFLHGTSISDVPCPGSWVRIIQAGIYKGDLALVLSMPSKGDIVTITVVPHFNPSKKRKSNARAAPALLDPKFMAKFLPNENKIHIIGSCMFYANGLESLQAPSAHALKIEPCPSEAELLLFQSSLMLLNEIYETKDISPGLLDVIYDLEHIIWHAVKKSFHNKSRRLWHTGDWV